MILGIDPGLYGAIATLTPGGDLVAIEDIPSIADGAKGRRALNAPLLWNLIAQSHATVAYCEMVGPRPTDGVVGAFGFGRSRGVLEGVLAAAGIPVVMIAPPVWKRTHSIPAGREYKDVARARAIARWPAQARFFARKADCDRRPDERTKRWPAAFVARKPSSRVCSGCRYPIWLVYIRLPSV